MNTHTHTVDWQLRWTNDWFKLYPGSRSWKPVEGRLTVWPKKAKQALFGTVRQLPSLLLANDSPKLVKVDEEVEPHKSISFNWSPVQRLNCSSEGNKMIFALAAVWPTSRRRVCKEKSKVHTGAVKQYPWKFCGENLPPISAAAPVVVGGWSFSGPRQRCSENKNKKSFSHVSRNNAGAWRRQVWTLAYRHRLRLEQEKTAYWDGGDGDDDGSTRGVLGIAMPTAIERQAPRTPRHRVYN